MSDNIGAIPHPHRTPEDFPFAYGRTTFANPWETVVPAYCEGPDIVYADGVLHAGTPAWVPRRLADLRMIYRDSKHFSNADMAPFAPLVGENWQVLPLESNPPEHGRYRRALQAYFTPGAIARLDEEMHRGAREYATALRDRGECDFMESFAFKFPIRIFLQMMGMPHEMIAQFLHWENGLLHSPDLETLATATREVVNYLTRTIELRKREPRDDLISKIIASRANERELTDSELLGVCFNLFIGGLDSVSTNMGWQIFHLATHPEDQRRLRADRNQIPVAIDEMQRYYAAITTYRRCVEPFDVAGVTIMPGEYVAMSTTVAGRDDREYATPNLVQFERRPNHVTFGFGPHTCLGVHLAKREMAIALQELLEIVPEFQLQPGIPIRTMLHSTVQPEVMPILFG